MLKESEYVKLRVGVPSTHADKLRKLLGELGAGRMGKYSHASGSWKVVGRFIPDEDANPAIGSAGVLEEVEEEVIETLCHKDMLEEVVQKLREVHPYEEPPIDIIPRLEIV